MSRWVSLSFGSRVRLENQTLHETLVLLQAKGIALSSLGIKVVEHKPCTLKAPLHYSFLCIQALLIACLGCKRLLCPAYDSPRNTVAQAITPIVLSSRKK